MQNSTAIKVDNHIHFICQRDFKVCIGQGELKGYVTYFRVLEFINNNNNVKNLRIENFRDP